MTGMKIINNTKHEFNGLDDLVNKNLTEIVFVTTSMLFLIL